MKLSSPASMNHCASPCRLRGGGQGMVRNGRFAATLCILTPLCRVLGGGQGHEWHQDATTGTPPTIPDGPISKLAGRRQTRRKDNERARNLCMSWSIKKNFGIDDM